jgi:hypothetical protein
MVLQEKAGKMYFLFSPVRSSVYILVDDVLMLRQLQVLLPRHALYTTRSGRETSKLMQAMS